MSSCDHKKISCLNPFELIRKYQCSECGEVMMCECEKEHGQRFLAHQLNEGCLLETQERLPVTLGFQKNICPECRGERPIQAPVEAIPGRTSKILRYYWREIAHETTRRFYEANSELDPKDHAHSEFSFPNERKKIEKQVIEEIKLRHDESPKYQYCELSQNEVIRKTDTEVILEKAKYVNTKKRKAEVLGKNGVLNVEEFASEYFSERGYCSIKSESVPFHVIFGVYMWVLIQDPNDPINGIVGFGSRTEFEESRTKNNIIYTQLPSDFGSKGYYQRRETQINNHIEQLKDLIWLFDYWMPYSHDFRQYLWAHRTDDVEIARKIIEILPEETVKRILTYLVRNYWGNYCGWPDLFLYNGSEHMFVEVKSSNDKLSEDQKNWLFGNQEHMGFKAKIFKVGR